MKKYLLGLAVLLMGTAVLTSCGDDDDDNNYYQSVEEYATGAYVVNSGNMYSNIESSLTGISYETSTATQNVFKKANGRSLGNTANDGIIYGDKMYLVVDQENTIEVLDKYTKESIKQIKTTELLGNAEGSEPRHIISNDGKVYFTTYGGYVAAVDTVNFDLQAKYQVGSYPEGLAVYGEYIYVANSNYAMGGGTLSRINWTKTSDNNEDPKKIEGINNPTAVFATMTGVYVVDNQYYDASYNAYGENAFKVIDWAAGTSTKIADGNYVAMYIKRSPDTRMQIMQAEPIFYILNAPYGGSVSYSTYNALSKQVGSFTPSEALASPCGIAVDPLTENVFILSYSLGDAGYADYNANGYVVEFQNDGTKLNKYTVGVGPCAVFFDSAVRTETKYTK